MKKVISICLTLMLACSLPAAAFAHGGHHNSPARHCEGSACMVNGVCNGSCTGTGACLNYSSCKSACTGAQSCLDAGYCLGHSSIANQNTSRGYCHGGGHHGGC